MKKLLSAILIALIAFAGLHALAENIILPHPGYYFGKTWTNDDVVIWFDEYPEAEYEAYVSLLTDTYGMEITETGEYTNGKECYLSLSDVEALVCCFYEDDGDCGLEIFFWGDVTLSAMETYIPASTETEYNSLSGLLGSLFGRSQSDSAEEAPAEETAPAPSEIAWDDGATLADPGEFLGYDIYVLGTNDFTNYNYGGNYFEIEYSEAPINDIWKYINALDESPYFEICGSYEARAASYIQVYYNYIGADAELAASCEEGKKKSGKRECDLMVQIHYRDRENSTFRIQTYPGFSVNSDTDNIALPAAPDDGSRERCVYCSGDGRCNNCGGSGFVQQYAAGYKDEYRRVSCSSCFGGSCSFCDGDGWR